MSIGLPLGVWDPHEFTSATDLLAGGLEDGALWILFDGTGPIDAGIWPDTPRNGGGGVCAGGPALFVVQNPSVSQQQLDIQAGSGGPLTPIGGVTFVIQNPV